MNLGKIRVGIVGAGGNTRARHIPGLQAIDGVEIVSVCNRSLESGERVAKEFGISEVYRNWKELVNDKDVDAVMIGTWPYMHCPVTIAALAAGKHVLCEARMAMDAREAKLMFEAARARPEVVAQVVPSPFTLRVDATIKKLIAEGYVGRVLAVEIRGGAGWIDAESPMQWRQNFDYSGYNVMSLGIWYEAIMRWVGQAVAVTAMGKTFTKMRKTEAGGLTAVQVPEHIDVVGEMACGAQLHMQISSVTGFSGKPAAYVFGSEGTLCFQENKLFGGRKGDKDLKEIAIAAQDEGRWRVEEEFINAIRGKEEIELTTFRDGLKYMEFTDAAAKSMTQGRTITLGASGGF